MDIPNDIPDSDLERLLSTMIKTRLTDERMAALYRQGKIGFYPGCRGEEAIHLAVYPLRKDDWIFPGARELGAWLWRGHNVTDLVHQLFGNAADPLGGRQLPTHRADRSVNMVSVSAPVGTHIPQTVGVAHAAKLQKSGAVAMAFFGAGAAPTGDFHTGLNFAGVYQVPAIFICRHRLGSHGPQLAGSLADRARSYGVAHARADGSDLMAVLAVARAAAERARGGDGATLVELVLEAEALGDPIEPVRAALSERGLWDAGREQALINEHKGALEGAIDEARETSGPATASLFEHVYESAPPHLQQQRRELAAGSDS
ncbi:MAG: thiamine pyrophosphate-dependent dehydrogenase E1 component subunit alpha [Haliangiales bacterium]